MTDVTPDLDDVDVFDEDAADEREGDDENWIVLNSTDLMNQMAADRFLRREHANLVAIIGERSSGKTTLITAIYEKFQRGRFGGFAFANSRTLAGFERRYFTSRAVSGRASPATPRTSRSDGLRFFHLAVLPDAANGKIVDLMVSERAGETYREVRDSPVLSNEMIEVRAATHVVFVIDGGRMADKRLAAEAAMSTRGLLRSFAEQGTIASDAAVQVVTTKLDLLSANQAALDEVREFQQRLTAVYASKFRSFEHFEVTARDPTGAVPVASGVDALLARWTMPKPAKVYAQPTLPQLSSQMDLLMTRGSVR